jgi:hypothetical protein
LIRLKGFYGLDLLGLSGSYSAWKIQMHPQCDGHIPNGIGLMLDTLSRITSNLTQKAVRMWQQTYVQFATCATIGFMQKRTAILTKLPARNLERATLRRCAN